MPDLVAEAVPNPPIGLVAFEINHLSRQPADEPLTVSVSGLVDLTIVDTSVSAGTAAGYRTEPGLIRRASSAR